ncbi:putative bulb-type lectin domain, PAN/Apple domain-containing protein [Rosa chinensis]|uniref:Putative bulb-type lectin domain, PAN/Apple domain-containing protein n=1 Tax=Rosa chinensis TaxID=74649 RepID=A0A2P6QA32_ROSCH|nr:epidermis-specific secreted glycoprotein EP1 [Rosa chinensis]XP_024159285.1 epidermis-specific secreted glycoprotein EP1 [Rosa chinensis]PRQ31041.1 putative bulb-type lectin domain, PAN/Apple domain-containing protein [Rosa chinensis]PRQ31042.1 putative bulb-type lectin domain, PAN/Apple domain-containing protein [Rosa chinensis]
MSSPTFTNPLLSLFLFSIFAFTAQAQVPANETFTLINEGEFGPYVVEYFGDYRMLPQVFSSPFQLGFYNTTPNAFTLALRMGLTRSESLMRWVWEANRGNPVGENATFSLGTDGNLVLANADGRVAWQTNTSNKGVVGFTLLPTGNMVLYDARGNFVWQSFDSPTDTLLVGQSLRASGVSKLVSRASEKENKDGPYSLVLEPKGLLLYYKSSISKKSLLYSQFTNIQQGTLDNVTLNSATDDGFVWDLSLLTSGGNNLYLARPKFNGTLTYLRLGIDGNIKLYTYYGQVDSWEQTFTLFDRDSNFETECQLPERCGSLGVCEDNQCVACPTSNGLSGWSKTCAPEKLTSCKANSFRYYKVEGVDHFLSKYNTGSATKEVDCGKKCSSDCKCLGYFYNRDTSRCLIAYELKTLTKVANSTHVGFIKAPNH